MRCIVSPTNDPFFNLATEEYLFKNFSEDIFFLYINTPSVVVGKHQNAIAEINPVFVFENNVKVVRRMSGGGAVYHDPGNINFSFQKTVEDTAKVSFKSFNLPVLNLLRQLGIPAEISNRNDIVVNGFKISGHAQHVFRNRVMSHGTLLIDTDLQKLSNALRKGTAIYESKAIKSVQGKVANVSGYLSRQLSVEEFIELFNHHVLNTFSDAVEYQFCDSENNSIKELAKNKYSTWDWNFGYSPAYIFRKELNFSNGKSLTCFLTVEKGLIIDLKFEGNVLKQDEISKTEKGLINQPHHPEFINNFISRNSFTSVPSGQLFNLFF